MSEGTKAKLIVCAGIHVIHEPFTAVKGSWMTWIPAHTINFAFVPSDMRLLYINTIQIFFNMFMSVIGNTEAVAAE